MTPVVERRRRTTGSGARAGCRSTRRTRDPCRRRSAARTAVRWSRGSSTDRAGSLSAASEPGRGDLERGHGEAAERFAGRSPNRGCGPPPTAHVGVRRAIRPTERGRRRTRRPPRRHRAPSSASSGSSESTPRSSTTQRLTLRGAWRSPPGARRRSTRAASGGQFRRGHRDRRSPRRPSPGRTIRPPSSRGGPPHPGSPPRSSPIRRRARAAAPRADAASETPGVGLHVGERGGADTVEPGRRRGRRPRRAAHW